MSQDSSCYTFSVEGQPISPYSATAAASETNFVRSRCNYFSMNSYGFSLMPDSPVLVIGAAGVDIVGHLRSELSSYGSSPARIRTSFGGVARNVAENLARLGHPVTLLSAVGADQAGDRLLDQAAAAGVDVNHVLRNPNYPTGTYIGILGVPRTVKFAVDDMRAVTAITPQVLKENVDLFREASVIFLDANLSKESLRTAFSLARRANRPVCADPTAAGLARRLLPYMGRLHLVSPNEAEASVLTEHTIDPSHHDQALFAAKFLVGLGVEIAVISLGEFGLCYATSEINGHIPAIRTEVVDPTGAGDALVATLIYSLLNDIPIDEAMRLGVTAASMTLRHPGAVVPDLSLQKIYDQLVI
jgi:pseudouridine kinase